MIRKISILVVCAVMVLCSHHTLSAASQTAMDKAARLAAMRAQAGKPTSPSSPSSSSGDSQLRGDVREGFGLPREGVVDIGTRRASDVVGQAAQAISDLADRLTMSVGISAAQFQGFMNRFADIIDNSQAKGLDWRNYVYAWDGNTIKPTAKRS